MKDPVMIVRMNSYPHILLITTNIIMILSPDSLLTTLVWQLEMFWK